MGAADRACDHWHDGAGVLNHHAAFTLELEQALQAVDARVAVPYWDYTIDAALVDATGGNWWELSPLFQDDWFGSVQNLTDDRFVATGRWAYTAVPASPDSSDRTITNAYGLLRSPWNSVGAPCVCGVRVLVAATP